MSKQQKQQPANRPIEIEINGEKYHYIETMGAMMGFKQETGLDAPVDTEDNVKYMYHVVTCKAHPDREDPWGGRRQDGPVCP